MTTHTDFVTPQRTWDRVMLTYPLVYAGLITIWIEAWMEEGYEVPDALGFESGDHHGTIVIWARRRGMLAAHQIPEPPQADHRIWASIVSSAIRSLDDALKCRAGDPILLTGHEEKER